MTTDDRLVTNNDVGISLMSGEEADAIIGILTEELGDDVRVRDYLTYQKVETSTGQLEVRFDEVAELLGRRFTLGDFQVIFSSYYGRPAITEDMIGIYADMTAGITDPIGA